MKKTLSILLIAVVLFGILAGCGRNIEGTETVTNNANDAPVAAVTNDDGSLQRDKDGGMIVAVTDANGKPVKDENGEVETSAVAIEHGIIMDDVVEFSTFSIRTPKGWNATSAYNSVSICSDDKNETMQIVVYSNDKEDSSNTGRNIYSMVRNYEDNKVLKTEESTAKIAGADATVERTELTSDVIETKVLTLYTFEGDTVTYEALCYSKDAKTPNSTFEEVLNTMILY